MDIDIRLDNILKNSALVREKHNKFKKLMQFIRNIPEKIDVGKKIVVGNAGVADRLLWESGLQNVVMVAEPKGGVNSINQATKQIRDVEVVSLDVAAKYADDCVFIFLDNSMDKETFNTLLSVSKKTFNIYDAVEEENRELLTEYDEWIQPFTTEYERLAFWRRKLETTENPLIRKKYFKELIYRFLDARDFISAYDYIDAYIGEGFDENDSAFILKNDLDRLFQDIKQFVKSRDKYHDILLIWNDGLRYDELSQMPYLDDVTKKSMVFTKAYTTVYDTRGAMGALFNKRYQIDDYYRSDDDCELRTSLLGQEMKRRGYLIKGCIAQNISNKKNTAEMRMYDFSSRLLWNGLKDVICSYDNPVCLYIHEVAQTHNPYHNPYMNKDYYFIRGCNSKDYEAQLDSSRKYWDEQLAFYMDCFDYENYKIFFSDHGKPLDLEELCVLQQGYKEEYTHIVLLVSGPGIKEKKCSELFSLCNFLELVQYIFDPSISNYNNLFTGYALLQSIDRYNPGDIKKKLADGTDRRNLMSYRAIRTESDLLVSFRDGKTLYYVLPDLTEDLSGYFEYAERINELKKMNGNYFLDIDNIPFFSASKEIYQSDLLEL